MATAVQETSKVLHVEQGEDGVWVVKFDVPGEKVNTLSPSAFDEFTELLDRLENNADDIRGVVIISGKPDGFVAGADVKAIAALKTAEEGELLSRQVQEVFNRLENLPMPTVAAVNGACLGGGLELALACRYRLITNDPGTQLGLPEVQLGVIPGAGGTQRLPRLIGLRAALDMILTGKKVRARSAVKSGLAHEMVPKEILLGRARQIARRLGEEAERTGEIPIPPASQKRVASSVAGLLLEATIAGRAAIYNKAKAMLKSRVGKHYPAPYKALDAVFYTRGHSFEAGLEYEAKAFGELAVSDVCRNLISLFFATTAMKSEKYKAPNGSTPDPKAVKKVGVLGGGLMGGGIATVLMDKGVRTRVKDRDLTAASKAIAYAERFLDAKVKRRHIRPYEKQMALGLLSAGDDFSGFKNADVVIEAVFEDMKIKHGVLKEMEAVTRPDCIFATNTSSLPIAEIAKGAKRPENVVGMHFFSPVEKMPLLEVIYTPKTAGWVTSTVVALGKKMGKQVIVVKDAPGFYTTRALGAFMNEAIKLLLEGCSVEAVDKALTNFGFPVGPLTLMDEVGWDVGAKVLKTLTDAFSDRFQVTAEAKAVLATGRLGRKNGKGFYRYDVPSKKKAKKEVDTSVYDSLPGGRWRNDQSERVIQERCVFAFLNEAAHILGEGILLSPRDGDIGAIFGLGFPPFLGGPFRYMDSLGIDKVTQRLGELTEEYSKSFEPAEILVQMHDEKRTFYGAGAKARKAARN